MNKFQKLFFLILAGILLVPAFVQAAANASSHTFTTKTITIPTDPAKGYIHFDVDWTSDDVAENSDVYGEKGQIDLIDNKNKIIDVLRIDNPSATTVTTGLGSAEVYLMTGDKREGSVSGIWDLSKVTPGNYTLKFYDYTSWDKAHVAAKSFSYTRFSSRNEQTYSAPTLLSATPGACSSNTITLSWNAPSPSTGLTGLNIYRDSGSGFVKLDSSPVSASATTYTDS